MESPILLMEREICTPGTLKTPSELAPTLQIPMNLASNLLVNSQASNLASNPASNLASNLARSNPSLSPHVDPNCTPLSSSGDLFKSLGSESQIPDHETISSSKSPPVRILTLSFEELHAWHQVLQNFKESIKSNKD